MTNFFPKYFADRAIAIYVVLLILVSVAFGYPIAWYWWLFGLVEVGSFFYFSNAISKVWQRYEGKNLEHRLFLASAVIRIIYVLFSYLFYDMMTGAPFEFSPGDSLWYHDMGCLGADIVWGADVKWSVFFEGVSLTDLGYPVWLTIVYSLTGKSVILSRCVKALISAGTAVLMYRIARRNFGESVGRMTAVFFMLMPNFIFYCGINLKETEMLFLSVLFIEKADHLMHSTKASFTDIFLMILAAAASYFFRGVLAVLLFLSFGCAIVLGNARIKKGGKWVIEGLFILLFMGVLVWNRGAAILGVGDYSSIQAEQEANIQWRATREGGNALATNASSAVYAPLIFTIPFPTMVDVGFQEDQIMIHGGNFVKNITSFLTILALILLFKSGKWRDHMLPLSFMLGYLLILIFSNYAHSERFHIPSLPFELMFAAYGVSQFKGKHKNWFAIWLAIIFIADVGWSWFKLRGRGM